MSFPFRYSFCPPAHTHWKSWIARACGYSRVATEAFIRGLALVELKSGLPKLPRDVWNIIVGHIFREEEVKDDPQRWEGNHILWLEDWLSDPVQQTSVPLILPSFNGLDQHSSVWWDLYYNPLEPQMTAYIQPSYDCCGSRSFKVTRHATDFFLGVRVSDPHAIVKCEVVINSCLIYEFAFEDRYRAFCQSRDGKREYFYFLPNAPVLPVVCLPYSDIVVNVTSYAPVQVALVSAVLVYAVRESVKLLSHLLNKRGVVKSFVKNCGIAYLK